MSAARRLRASVSADENAAGDTMLAEYIKEQIAAIDALLAEERAEHAPLWAYLDEVGAQLEAVLEAARKDYERAWGKIDIK